MNDSEVKVKEAVKVDESHEKEETNTQPVDQNFSEFLMAFLKRHWMTILALIYVISPIDFIPNALVPVAGTMDDLVVLLYVFYQEYRNYKKRKEGLS